MKPRFPSLPHLICLCGGLLLVCSCGSQERKDPHETARQLFEESVRLLATYSDSIRNAGDSASLHRMSEGINDRMVKVVWQFPADTDLSLTEEENDSLIHMSDRLVRLISEKRQSLSNAADSIPGDSVAVVPTAGI